MYTVHGLYSYKQNDQFMDENQLYLLVWSSYRFWYDYQWYEIHAFHAYIFGMKLILLFFAVSMTVIL